MSKPGYNSPTRSENHRIRGMAEQSYCEPLLGRWQFSSILSLWAGSRACRAFGYHRLRSQRMPIRDETSNNPVALKVVVSGTGKDVSINRLHGSRVVKNVEPFRPVLSIIGIADIAVEWNRIERVGGVIVGKAPTVHLE